MNDCLLPFQKLDVYRVAKALVVAVHGAKIKDSELDDQARRASKSAFLHLSEGLPNEGVAMRRKYFVGARNSLCETVGAVDAAAAVGAVSAESAKEIAALGTQLYMLIRGLMR